MTPLQPEPRPGRPSGGTCTIVVSKRHFPSLGTSPRSLRLPAETSTIAWPRVALPCKKWRFWVSERCIGTLGGILRGRSRRKQVARSGLSWEPSTFARHSPRQACKSWVASSSV